MGIKENYERIKEAISLLKYSREYLSNDEKPYLFGNLDDLRKGVELLSEIDFLESYVDELKKDSGIFDTHKNSEKFVSSQENIIVRNVEYLRAGLTFLLDYFDKTTKNEKNLDAITIKLPELNSFDDLNKISNELKKAIELPIIDAGIDKSKTEIISADRGSIWLNVALGTIGAVKLIAGIVWAASVIRKKRAEAKIFEEHAKTLELKNDALKDIINAQKIQVKNILNAEAQAIASEHYDHTDPETIKRLELSISTTSDLIDRGVKILPTGNSNDSLKELFPDYDKLNLIQSTIKQIRNE
ncbi:hypothetical protein [Patiriisocius marinistellae]|uniref:hypothetical protein n=1 Tax=Patiriisocius marinistellae TaxID=2494560 RepID=UPI00125E8FEB|nr:hypothetical protein [Patiriisocius marinistellae]